MPIPNNGMRTWRVALFFEEKKGTTRDVLNLGGIHESHQKNRAFGGYRNLLYFCRLEIKNYSL